MKKILKYTVEVVVWCAILAYVVFASRHCSEKSGEVRLRDISITVANYGDIRMVSPETVAEWLEESGFAATGTPIGEVNTEKIRKLITGKPFVKDMEIYTDLEGALHIGITQRQPLMRVITSEGYDFYVSDDDWIFPVPEGGIEYVPLVTGSFRLPFGRDYCGSLGAVVENAEKKDVKNYIFLRRLINFVGLMESDAFWKAQAAGINVVDRGDSEWREPEVEIIPRVGSHVVVFGSLDDVEAKFEKLLLFYKNVLGHEGWNTYRYINIKYKDQVVCTK